MFLVTAPECRWAARRDGGRMGPLLAPSVGWLGRISWRVSIRAIVANDGLHRAHGEHGTFLAADGKRDGAQNHAILPRIETPDQHTRFRASRRSALTPSDT
jgi:hypothetical protein